MSKFTDRVRSLFRRKAKETPEAAIEIEAADAQAEAAVDQKVAKPAKPKQKAEPVPPRPVCSEERLSQIVLGPHVSEKTVQLAEKHGQHSFEVARDATRAEVKTAVEQLMGVGVQEVRIINVHGKRKRAGTRSSWRKALVMTEPGQDMDMTEVGT